MSTAEMQDKTKEAQPEAMPTAAEVLAPEQTYKLAALRRDIRFHNENCVFVNADGEHVDLMTWWKRLAGSRGGDAEQYSYTKGKRIAESIVECGIEASPTEEGLKWYRQRMEANRPAPGPDRTPIVEATLQVRRTREAKAASIARNESQKAARNAEKAAKLAAERAAKEAEIQRGIWAEYISLLGGHSASPEEAEKLADLMDTLHISDEDLQRDMEIVKSTTESDEWLEMNRRRGCSWAGPLVNTGPFARRRPQLFDDGDPPALLRPLAT